MIRREHNKGILHAPVGSIGHMADAGKTIKRNIVRTRMGRQLLQQGRPQATRCRKTGGKVLYTLRRQLQQTLDQFVPLAAFFNFCQSMLQRFNQQTLALGVGQQIVFQIRITRDHPDITQHFEQHPCRTACTSPAAQLFHQLPTFLTEQAHHNLAIGKRSVVVGNFANAFGGHGWVRYQSWSGSKETLIDSSPRQRPGSRTLISLDSGLRRGDGYSFNQRFPKGS